MVNLFKSRVIKGEVVRRRTDEELRAGYGTRLMSFIDLYKGIFPLCNYCEKYNIPKYLKPPYGKLHLTLLQHPESLDICAVKYFEPVIVTPDQMDFKIIRLRGMNCLVLLINNPLINERLNEAHTTHRKVVSAQAHITLSYNVGENFKLPPKPDFDIWLTGEIVESFCCQSRYENSANTLSHSQRSNLRIQRGWDRNRKARQWEERNKNKESA